MANTAPYQPTPLTPEQRRAVLGGLGRLSGALKSGALAELIRTDRSLYHHFLWPAERRALVRVLREHGELVERMPVEELLDLLAEGRPDLHAQVVRDGGRAWFARQWQELRAIIRA